MNPKDRLVKRIYKYATGDELPKGAIYLNTVTQTKQYTDLSGDTWRDCFFVWHYFLVKAQEE